MFAPEDPRFDEILALCAPALAGTLTSPQRARWRELCAQLLGSLHDSGAAPERRQALRADAQLQVGLLQPQEAEGLHTSSVGAGGVSMELAKPLPTGADVELSIVFPGRSTPLLAHGRVTWSREGSMGVCFTNVLQNDREALEAVTVRTLLGRPG